MPTCDALRARPDACALGRFISRQAGPPETITALFSDPNANTIYRWSPDGQVSVYRAKSGYKGVDVGEYGQPGSNGLTLDAEGRLTLDEHGNRRVTRLERNGQLTVLADRYQGKRLNSPNDLVYRSDGALYFTDPPFGLPKAFDDPRKELPYSGVFCLKDGALKLVSKDLLGPNGIAFSPDERFLYVTNWDPKRKVVMRYEVQPSCELRNGRVFFDMTSAPGEEALDGVKIDREGHLFVSGPGGARRRVGDLAGRQAPRHHRGARAAREHGVRRRRRADPLHDRPDRRVPDAPRPRGHPAPARAGRSVIARDEPRRPGALHQQRILRYLGARLSDLGTGSSMG